MYLNMSGVTLTDGSAHARDAQHATIDETRVTLTVTDSVLSRFQWKQLVPNKRVPCIVHVQLKLMTRSSLAMRAALHADLSSSRYSRVGTRAASRFQLMNK